MAGVGFDAFMIRDANPTLKRKLGSVAYVWSAIRHLRGRLFRATVDVDGRTIFHGPAAMVLVANCGMVSGGLQVFPEARHDDGLLDVAVLSARGIRQWTALAWRIVRGSEQHTDAIQRAVGSTVVVRLSRPMPYELDGEVRPVTTSLRFEVEPNALAVRMPPPAS
jgi:diacylglycerol kinase family enzyme